jgi:chemotaxis protein CheD
LTVQKAELALSVQPVVRSRYYLQAGHLFADAHPTAVTTILGSCVSVCIWDGAMEVGGINHYLLPHRIGAESANARFGSLATIELIQKVEMLGARRRGLRAKIFGGASTLGPTSGRPSAGKLNADLAVDMLQEERIPVVAVDVGGTHGRKIIFHTDSGETFVRLL